MKVQFNISIEQVSSETKKRVSKIGTPSLLKKYTQHNFVSEEEVVAARHYLVKRGIEEKELQATDKFYLTYIIKQEVKSEANTQIKKDKVEKSKKTVEKSANEQENDLEVIMRLTTLEFIMFERFIFMKSQQVADNIWEDLFESHKQFKGVLGSLIKKNIFVELEDHMIGLGELGQQMISNQLPWKKRVGYERNVNFAKKRKMIEIDGKMWEKSAYVRLLLKKNNHLTCNQANEIISQLGFSKLYYSEFKRCKDQLGIVDRYKDEEDI